MLFAEQFQRCEKCGGGWFEKKTLVLVRKDTPVVYGKPEFYQTRVKLQCITCEHAQYEYDEE